MLNYVLFIILSCYFLPVLISTLIDPTNVSNGLVLNYVFFITLSWHCLSVNQGWDFALWFFERIACFLSAREQNSNSLIFLSKSLFCSFLKIYSMWANRSRLLFCEEQREPIAKRQWAKTSGSDLLLGMDLINVSNGLVLKYVFFIAISWHCSLWTSTLMDLIIISNGLQ